MERIARAYCNMAVNMAVTPLLANASTISAQEQEAVIRMSMGDPLSYDTSVIWIDMFKQQVAQRPDSTAVVDSKGQLTYKQLDEQSDAVAAYLVGQGVLPDDFVAVKMGRVKEFIVAVIGINKAGAAYVPIDPEYPADRIEYMCTDSQAKVVLTEETIQEAILSPFHTSLNLATPERRCYMIYTSGSTGKPKGVVISQASVTAYIAWLVPAYDYSPGKRNLHHPSFSFDASTMDIFLPIAAGGETHILSEDLRKDLGGMARYIKEHEIYGCTMSTAIGMALLNTYDLDLHYIMLGGEKFMPVKKTATRLFNGYGPTEFTCASSYHIIDQDKEGDIPIGRAVPNSASYICDPEGQLLPQGVAGELCLSGIQIAQGYWGREELTNQKFIQCPFNNSLAPDASYDKMYRTGDLARYNEEGEMEYVGRIDTQVKLRGFRIELGEIEHRASLFPGIGQVAAEVFNSQTLCLYYTANEALDKVSLKAFLSQTLTGYMVPTAYIQLETMPMTPNGKINRKVLPAPEVKSDTAFVAPEGQFEEMFAHIFEMILKVSPIGANDDFFELGGTSLNAIRVIVEASKLGVNIVFNDLFLLKTPRALAAFVKQSQQQGRTVKTDTVVLSSPERKTAPGDVSPVTGHPYQDYDELLQRNTLDAIRKGTPQPVGTVLLAGATGYMGIHILHELLRTDGEKIYCPIRCKEGENPMSKLKTLYYYYFARENFSGLEQRVVAFKAEMSQRDALKNFNGRELTVINCVANVKHFSSGNDIEHVNTDSVHALIDFCLQSDSRLIHVSTVSIAGDRVNGVPAKDDVLTEQRFWLGQQVNNNQYVHSKFVAEDLVLDAVKNRGLNAKIMRVGNLSARQADGEFQINFNTNNFMATLRAYVALGEIPFDELDGLNEFSPIDELARAILLLTETPRECVVFHPYNNHTILQVDILEALARTGLFVKGVERNTFEDRLNNAMQNPMLVELLRPLMAYDSAAGVSIEDVDYDNEYTTQVLYRLGFKWRPVDEDYVERFAKALYVFGFFDEQ